jgi:hypothetical protein
MLGETRIKGGLAIRVKCKGTGLFCQEKMKLSLRNIPAQFNFHFGKVLANQLYRLTFDQLS